MQIYPQDFVFFLYSLSYHLCLSPQNLFTHSACKFPPLIAQPIFSSNCEMELIELFHFPRHFYLLVLHAYLHNTYDTEIFSRTISICTQIFILFLWLG
jgi:hypothetical protein